MITATWDLPPGLYLAFFYWTNLVGSGSGGVRLDKDGVSNATYNAGPPGGFSLEQWRACGPGGGSVHETVSGWDLVAHYGGKTTLALIFHNDTASTLQFGASGSSGDDTKLLLVRIADL